MTTLCPGSKAFLKKGCNRISFVGVIEYSVSVEGGSANDTTVSVSLLDRDGNYVIRDIEEYQENLEVPQAKLWWPYLMDPQPAYLYTLEVRKTTSRILQAFRCG
jgi:beta-glucuronidase